MTVRTRFAPSPTGTLHIGNVRTALFAWLYARKHKGQFILRIEDTDAERSTEESARDIIAELNWLGLAYDEGPFFQSQRQALYQQAAERLLDEGKAYHCYCTKEEIAERAERAAGLAAKSSKKGIAAWGYDGKCRSRTTPRASVEPTLRIKTPDEGITRFEDRVHQQMEIENQHLSDIVIVRANGMPTYNFAVVVDDLDMNITHVLRGDDHLHNTFQQINLIKQLGGTIPTYAHLPMVLRADSHRLSKRDQAAGIANYRAQGYLPHALLNYLARLGWSKGDQEIFSMDELIEYFELSAIHKSAASLNPEKLDWLNAHYLAELPIEQLSEAIENRLTQRDINIKQTPPLRDIVAEMRTRHKTLSALADGLLFIYQTPSYDTEVAENYRNPKTIELLKALVIRLKQVEAWDADTLKTTLSDFSTGQNIKIGMIGKPLRFILTANNPAPALGLVMEWLGKAACVERVERFVGRDCF